MIIVAGTARILPEHRQTAVEQGQAMAAASEAEDGCIAYRVAVDVADPNTFAIFEVWEDEAALQHHFTTAHFQAFARLLSTAMDGEGVFRKYQVSSDGPLFG
jgi:quinol monooxygenase YgiN